MSQGLSRGVHEEKSQAHSAPETSEKDMRAGTAVCDGMGASTQIQAPVLHGWEHPQWGATYSVEHPITKLFFFRKTR